jgi:hypothetical protein
MRRGRTKLGSTGSDFALWATACESAFRPPQATAYANNRHAAIENIIDADPLPAHVREIMADRTHWTGSASDLLQVGANRSGWPKSPRALAGRLRRAQTFLRALGNEIVFHREGRFGTRTSGARTNCMTPSAASATTDVARL